MDPEARLELMSIINGLSADDRTFVAGLPEEDVIRLHHGLGTAIRNQIRAGGLRTLFRWSRALVPDHVKHLDDVTWPIVLEVWKTLKMSADEKRK